MSKKIEEIVEYVPASNEGGENITTRTHAREIALSALSFSALDAIALGIVHSNTYASLASKTNPDFLNTIQSFVDTASVGVLPAALVVGIGYFAAYFSKAIGHISKKKLVLYQNSAQ